MSGAMVTIQIDKAVERKLQRALHALPDKIFEKVVKSAANLAMRPVIRAARAKVPVNQGLLKASLGTRRKTYKRAKVVYVAVGPREGFKDPETGAEPRFYAHLVELGTAPHNVPAPPGGLRIGESVVHGGVEHPGAKPRPFLRPAIDENKQAVMHRYREQLWRGIEKEAKRLAGR